MKTLVPAAATYITFRDILKSSVRSFGPFRTGQFEDLCAQRCEKRYAVYLSSLMRASYVACALAKRLTGRETVILPRYACPSFTHGILAAGMKIRHCDLDPATLQIDPLQVDSLFDSTVAALIAPNLFGRSSDLVALKAIPIGGGMVISDHPILDRATLAPGRSPVPFLRSIAFRIFSNPLGYRVFRAAIKQLRLGIRAFSMEDTMRKTTDEVSYTFDPNEKLRGISRYQDSLGCQFLSSLDAQREARCRNYKDLCGKLKKVEPRLKAIEFDRQKIVPNMIRAPILVPPERRPQLIEALHKAGFEASPMYCEVGLQVDESQFPGAARINNGLLTLPCNWYMNASRNEVMVNVIAHALIGEKSCT